MLEDAARPLPRWALWLLCVAYLLPGYAGREPWKSTDVVAYAAIAEVAQGSGSWWWPAFLGQPVSDFAPLIYGLGALSVGLLPSHWTWAYQLPAMLALLGTLFTTWQAAFRLALLPGAQPLTLAFGGHAAPLDYARAIADSATLALLATLGLAQLSHEVGPAVFWACGVAMWLLAGALALDPRHARQPWRWLGWLLAGAVVLALTHQMVWLVGAAFTWLLWLLLARCPQADASDSKASIAWRILPLGVVLLLVVGLLQLPIPDRWGGDRLSAPDAGAWLKLLLWFTWPVGPLAVWTVWKWRRQLRMAHVLLPLGLALLGVGLSGAEGGSDDVLLSAVVPLAVLAGFALPTLRRSASAWIDWFSLLFFSFCALAIWVVWLAMVTGFPSAPARNVARLAPGFQPVFEPLALVVAALATLAWLWVVGWRASRHRAPFWKSLVIAASGGTLSWLLLMTLWLPLLNHARGYKGMVTRLAEAIAPGHCAVAWQLQEPQIAALLHQGHVRLKRASDPDASSCEYLIAPTSPTAAPPTGAGPDWEVVRKVPRLTDRKETLVLWRRVKPHSAAVKTPAAPPAASPSPGLGESAS